MKSNFQIHSKMVEICGWLFVKINGFPKSQRHVLGRQIEATAIKCIELIIEANDTHGNPELILAKLQLLNVKLQILRDLLQIATDQHFMTPRSLGFIVQKIDEIGRMAGGWAKRYSA